MDLLLPYRGHHGPRHSNRYVRSCQQAKYGDMTYSMQAAYKSNGSNPTDITPPLVISKYMIKNLGDMFSKRQITIYYQLIKYPWQTLSVLEPLEANSCDNKNSSVRATVLDSAKRMNCLAASNAGFFNTHTGECVGNTELFCCYFFSQASSLAFYCFTFLKCFFFSITFHVIFTLFLIF